ncbi:hypothetical protein ACOMHN_066499 [Nucella lapillus]
MVFAQGPETLLKERRFMYPNTPSPDGEDISFETFSPRMLPSYGNQLSRDNLQQTAAAFRDSHHTLATSRPFSQERKGGGGGGGWGELGAKRQQPRTYNPYVKTSSLVGGKRVTFKNDSGARDLPSGRLASESGGGLDWEGKDGCPGGMDSLPSLHPRSHVDDDGTPTSGSYTLNVDDDIDDLPPPLAYSVA